MAKISVVCECGHVVEGETEDEFVAAAQVHAKEAHNMDLTREQVLAMVPPGSGQGA
jgi:predicted small metal-binding protein